MCCPQYCKCYAMPAEAGKVTGDRQEAGGRGRRKRQEEEAGNTQSSLLLMTWVEVLTHRAYPVVIITWVEGLTYPVVIIIWVEVLTVQTST